MVDHDFEPSHIKMQHKEAYELSSAALYEKRSDVSRKLTVIKEELEEKGQTENMLIGLIVALGLGCLLVNHVIQYGSFADVESQTRYLREFSSKAIDLVTKTQ